MWKNNFLFHCLCAVVAFFVAFPTDAAGRVSKYTREKIQSELPTLELALGDDVLIRTFKKESLLELWMRPRHQSTYVLFRSYPICYYSGPLGPKLRQGDKVTPEGFYGLTKKSLNPNSRFHLALNIGYPNRYDRYHGRTGSLLMIHGACDAIGCFAMSNGQIEEIYYLVEQALANGQSKVPVHAFPFHLQSDNLMAYENNRWKEFWQQLKIGYDWFNERKIPPVITVQQGKYHFSLD